MSVTINSSAPTAAHRGDFEVGFSPGATYTDSATLTWPAAAGVYHIANKATAMSLTLPTGTIPSGSRIHGMNVNAGALSFVAGGSEDIEMDAVLPSTVGQWAPFELRRGIGDYWVRVA